jgi:hypothetical protein
MHIGLVDRPFVPLIGIVPSFFSSGTPHHAAREVSISEGRKLNIRILPAAHNELQVLGSFTCPKVGTWDRLFDFLSEGRHAEDFYIRKIRRLRPGLNPRTREPEASMLTSRPPKPLRFYFEGLLAFLRISKAKDHPCPLSVAAVHPLHFVHRRRLLQMQPNAMKLTKYNCSSSDGTTGPTSLQLNVIGLYVFLCECC